ncbi:hypothetical protein N665_0553s0006 [Sinapis alba]|nr:hypothetical protein N665_0553s0006 [Sinapis alba]
MRVEHHVVSQTKGKAFATKPSPARDADGTLLDDFELIHRDPMMDTCSLGRSQRMLVSESARLHREEVARALMEAQICARDGQGILEELTVLAPELLRSPETRGQTWGNVLKTRSTVGSVKRLLRECRGDAEELGPWSLPIGFQCVYESYFQDDTKFLFPIPWLITSYVGQRDAAISQFLNGSWRLIVALVVMAVEIDVTLNVLAFEDLTFVNPLDEGLWSVKMRPNYNVVKGYSNKTVDLQRSYFFVKSDDSAFEDPLDNNYRVLWNVFLGDHPTSREYPDEFLLNVCAIARLGQERWGNTTRDRIRRCVDRISRRDWNSIYLPAANTVKRRISLFTRDEQREINASRGMKGLPDLSAMIEARVIGMNDVVLGQHDLSLVSVAATSKKKGGKKRSHDDLPTREARKTTPKGVDAAVQADEIEPSKAKNKKKKKQPSNRRSPPREEPTLNPALADDPDDVSPPALLQLRKKLNKTIKQGEVQCESPLVAVSNATTAPSVVGSSALPTPRTSTSGVLVLKKVPRIIFPDRVSFEYDRPTLFIYVLHKWAELVSQVRGGPRPLLPVVDLIYKDEYIDASRTKLLGDGSMNFIIDKIRQCPKRGDRELGKADLRVAHSTISALEMRTGRLEEKIGVGAEAHKKELDRLRESGIFEVTKERVRVETEMIEKCNKHFASIRDYQTRRAPFDTMKCLEDLKAGGPDIPQETIAIFAAQEKQFEEEALKLDVGEILEADLTLSPLKLDSQDTTPSPDAEQSAILLLSDTSSDGQGEDQEEEKSVDGREDKVDDDNFEGMTEDQDVTNREASQHPPSPNGNTDMPVSLEGARTDKDGGASQVGSQDAGEEQIEHTEDLTEDV